ncbi:MAG: galactokinase family protein, partial [Oscillospiraceae bacterium]|nr:galactokinase family protein [Oscillospiraceae bacterium]
MLHDKLILDNSVVSALVDGFRAAFGGSPERYFSAPGRTEIGGNHT